MKTGAHVLFTVQNEARKWTSGCMDTLSQPSMIFTENKEKMAMDHTKSYQIAGYVDQYSMNWFSF